MVVDSRQDPRAAWAGSILITRLMVRGGAGFVTNGFYPATDIQVLADFAAWRTKNNR